MAKTKQYGLVVSGFKALRYLRFGYEHNILIYYSRLVCVTS